MNARVTIKRTMSDPDIFMDSSALVADVISTTDASRTISQLAEANLISVTISEQIVVETERVPEQSVAQRCCSMVVRYLLKAE